MATHAAFLRAVNLGRNRRVSGAELVSLFEGLGLADVAAFRTSGNVVFDAGREPAGRLVPRIERGLARSLGYEVPIYLRSTKEVLAIAAHEPFARALVERSKGKLQVILLLERPAAKARRDALALAGEGDLLAFGQRELYWLPSGGTQQSALDQKALARTLGPTTVRTRGTIEQLAAKFFS